MGQTLGSENSSRPAANRGAGTEALFDGKEAIVRETYARLAAAVGRFGRVTVEAKKTSIHLVHGTDGSAFAGVHPRKSALLLTIRSAAPLTDHRVRKVDQVSKHRYHNDVLLTAPTDVDGELLGWLRSAYELASGST